MRIIAATRQKNLFLGRKGENLASRIVFDLTDLITTYGDGVAELIYQRPGDAQPYPVAAYREADTLLWDVSSADTDAANDFGKCELRWRVGDMLAKTHIWITWVDPAMDTPSETTPPEPEQGWVDQVLSAGAAAKDAVTKYPRIGENGNWYIWDAEKGAYTDTGHYAGGTAPYIGDNGNWYIGTTDSGVSATGPAGKDGVDGHTPEYGVDYGTPEQISGIAQSAAEILQPDVNQIKDNLSDLQTAKMDLYSIKTAMDSVATPHTQYYLGNQTTVDIVLPDTANAGQIITVCWYNGDTAATLSITGTMLDFDFTPSANTRSEINALWDGMYWAVLGNEMEVPTDAKTA